MTPQSRLDWTHWGRLIARPTRERLGLSRRQLAHKAGVSVDGIVHLERGRTRHPTLRLLRPLCNALDLPLPGDEGLYLTLDGVSGDSLRRLVAAALYEFARRRRDAAHFALMIHLPSDRAALRIASATVAAERDLATDVLGLLCPDLDSRPLVPLPERLPRRRRTSMQPLPRHRSPHNPARPHG